jgi:hypothetical protein
MFLKGLFEDPSLFLKLKLRFFDEVEGEDEGGGEGEGTGEGGESGGEAAGQRAAGDKGDTKDGQSAMIPKHRFDEVNTGYQTYKRFGSPQDIQSKLDRLAKLEKMPQNRYTEDQHKEIREDLFRIVPELQGLLDSAGTSRKTFTSYGVTRNETYLKELGIEVNEENNRYLQELIGGVIASKPEYQQRFFSLDRAVYDDAWKETKGRFWPNLKRNVPGLATAQNKSLPKQPMTKKPGETKGKEEDLSGPLRDRNILDEASERAFARISEQQEE